MNRYLAALVIVLITAMGVYAQDNITQDAVDEVASRMFCPVCENEPLDQCYNPTCIQWKREIADLLAQGLEPNEIITSFVERYGDQVVGIPQDPVLRFLSFFAPILGTIIAVLVGFLTFRNWQKHKPALVLASDTVNQEQSVDSYRSQIERDLN